MPKMAENQSIIPIFLLFFFCFLSIFCFDDPLNEDFNPCNIDDSTCMPLEDFDTPMAPLFRKKLSVRIPKAHYYDASEPDQNLYRNLKIQEKMALFEVSTEKSTQILKFLIDNQYLRTEAITKSDNRWCLEGECNAFVYESSTVNKTIGIYSHSADLLQIIEYRSRSIFAVSSVYAEFSVPTVQRLQCEHKCRVFYWNEREMCLKQCKLRLEFDLVSVTSDLKRNFDFFVQSSAIQNFRMKYRKFLAKF